MNLVQYSLKHTHIIKCIFIVKWHFEAHLFKAHLLKLNCWKCWPYRINKTEVISFTEEIFTCYWLVIMFIGRMKYCAQNVLIGRSHGTILMVAQLPGTSKMFNQTSLDRWPFARRGENNLCLDNLSWCCTWLIKGLSTTEVMILNFLLNAWWWLSHQVAQTVLQGHSRCQGC